MFREILYQLGLVTLRQHWELQKELQYCKRDLGTALNQLEVYKGKGGYIPRKIGLTIVKKGK